MFQEKWLEEANLIKSIHKNVVDKPPQLLGNIKGLQSLLQAVGRCRMLPQTHHSVLTIEQLLY